MDYIQQGLQYMKEQNMEEAAKLFNRHIEEHPEDPVGYINFGNLLTHIKEYDRAKRFLKKH